MSSAISSVLVVDDEAAVRDSLVAIFKDEKVPHICAVGSAEEALEVMKKEPFTLIICDYKLKGMNGVAFMGRLRIKRDMTPILFITGVPDHDEVTQAATQLNAAFLGKPFTVSQLIGSVETLLAR